ncbi:MAG: LysR family transcriptional regulator [Pseudomonadota bacterium]
MRSLPPLTWFRSFEAAARTQSTTAAADEVGLTQSAVSQQIKSLETRLGTALFKRHARGLSLTDDGRRLLPQVEAALSDLQTAVAPFDLPKTDQTLAVAASISVIEWVLAPALPHFQKRWPGVAIRLAATIWPDEYAGRRADVEIRFGSHRQVGQGATPLTGSDLVAVKHPSLAGTLADLPWIETVGISAGWRDWCGAAGHPWKAPSVSVDSYGAAARLAQAGNGVALISAAIAHTAVRSGDLTALSDTTIPGIEAYFIACRSESPVALDFADWVRGLGPAASPR